MSVNDDESKKREESRKRKKRSLSASSASSPQSSPSSNLKKESKKLKSNDDKEEDSSLPFFIDTEAKSPTRTLGEEDERKNEEPPPQILVDDVKERREEGRGGGGGEQRIKRMKRRRRSRKIVVKSSPSQPKKELKKTKSHQDTRENIGFFIDADSNNSEEKQDGNEDVEEAMEVSEEFSKKVLGDPLNEKAQRKKDEIRERETIEKSLESFLFGRGTNSSNKESDSENDSDDDNDSIDNESNDRQINKELVVIQNSDEEHDEDDAVIKRVKGRKAAWEDNEDKDLRVKDAPGTAKFAANKNSNELYSKALKKKFQSIVGAPKWAELDFKTANEDQDSDDEFFRETTDMIKSKRSKGPLTKGRLDFRKLKDMNSETHTEGSVIKATEFHPTATVGLVAGINGTASLFQIDGKSNPKMQSINFQNFPIRSAHFSSDGREFIVSSNHFKHFHVYDMISGKDEKIYLNNKEVEQGGLANFVVSPRGDFIALGGRFGDIHILCAKSKHKLFSLKMNDAVEALTFSPDGETLYSHGTGGEVYVWDLNARECLHRFNDEGCLNGTAIAISRNNRLIATGSNSGVVNLYERHTIMSSRNPTPLKAIMNLTTSITDIKFSPSSEILAMSSVIKDNSIKLMHVPSMNIFENFPSLNFNLNRINCFDFSANGGYMSIGNNRGAANLYRLKHFDSY